MVDVPATSARAGRRTLVQTLALVVGATFLLVGILGFIPGITTNYDDMKFAGNDSGAELLGIFQVSILHNIVHILFGVGILMARTHEGALNYLLGAGVIYVVLFVYGLFVDWEGLRIHRTDGRHGHGALADELGPVSGFVLDGLYVAGDTVWCPEVEEAIERHRPAVAVVNGSGACFTSGGPLVMTSADVSEVVARVTTVVVVHLEAIDHCLETRAEVRAAVPAALVPEDGETLEVG